MNAMGNHTTESNRSIPPAYTIDIGKLDRESHPLLLAGTFLAVVLYTILAVVFSGPPIMEKTVFFVPIELAIRKTHPKSSIRINRQKTHKQNPYKPGVTTAVPSALPQTKQIETPDNTTPENRSMPQYSESHINQQIRNIPIAASEPPPLRSISFSHTASSAASAISVSPNNKKAIHGYARLVSFWPYRSSPPDSVKTAAHHLSDAMNEYTSIQTSADYIRKSSKPVIRYPLVYISANDFLTLDNPRQFLDAGLFLIDAAGKSTYGPNEINNAVHARLSELLGWNPGFRPLEKNHPLFHCYFDINAVPEGEHPDAPRSVYGIFSNNHNTLIGLFCPQGYGNMWEDRLNVEQRRFGVNIAVLFLAPGKWRTHDQRITFEDTSTGEFIYWRENGSVCFRARGTANADMSKTWLPDAALRAKRIVSFVTNRNSPNGMFNPQHAVTRHIFNYTNTYSFDMADHPSDGKRNESVGWGTYNIFEGWHSNKEPMYRYEYNSKSFTEWDDSGVILASSIIGDK